MRLAIDIVNIGDEQSSTKDLEGVHEPTDVGTVEAILDEVELAAVVIVVVVEVAHDSSDSLTALVGVLDFLGFLELELFPLFILGVELGEDEDELVEDAHGVGTGAAGGVEDFALVDGF